MDDLHTTHGLHAHAPLEPAGSYSAIARDHHRKPSKSENHLSIAVRLADKTCNKMGLGLRHDPGIVLMATPEATELHLSEVDIAKMEIMLEDSQASANKG